MRAPVLRPVLWLEAAIEADDALDGCRLVRYWGGQFGGEGLSGAVVGGADHGAPRRDGLRGRDARLVLEAEGGVPLVLHLRGLGPQGGPWAVSGSAETAAPAPLGWMNALWLTGRVHALDGAERWELFAPGEEAP